MDKKRFNMGKSFLRKLREKYSTKQMFDIARQKDTNPEAYAEYLAYVEQCRAEAKAELGIMED